MTAHPGRILCLAVLALAAAACARDESAQEMPDSLGEAIERNDRDQAEATVDRREAADRAEAEDEPAK